MSLFSTLPEEALREVTMDTLMECVKVGNTLKIRVISNLTTYVLIVEPLSSTDIISSNSDGSKIRIAYKGAPGAYNEAAALKTYPKCETVPCEDFESVFKVVYTFLNLYSSWRLNYCVGGEVTTMFHLDRPTYLLGISS